MVEWRPAPFEAEGGVKIRKSQVLVKRDYRDLGIPNKIRC
jgi:hypothetical protein